MFWGLVLQANTTQSSPNKTIHISHAVLDDSRTKDNVHVKVIAQSYHGDDVILCILNKSSAVQVNLDLIISRDDEITFRNEGGTVHLSGYVIKDYGEEGDRDDRLNQKMDQRIKSKWKI